MLPNPRIDEIFSDTYTIKPLQAALERSSWTALDWYPWISTHSLLPKKICFESKKILFFHCENVLVGLDSQQD